MEDIILDHIKGIKFSPKNPPIENLQILEYIPTGLLSIAQMVRGREIKNHKEQLVYALLNTDTHMIVNAFDWFVISSTNYTRIIGLIELMVKNNWKTDDLTKTENHKMIKKHCDDYVNEVLPNVNKWRDKIAAHPTATYPTKGDNLATIEFSLMSLVVFQAPYYQVRAKWVTKGFKSELPPWALTLIFEENLIPRFWPNFKLEKIKSN